MRGEIIIIGMGPGSLSYLTQEAKDEVLKADKIFFRMRGHPVYYWLKEQGKYVVSFDGFYKIPGITYPRVYSFISLALIKEVYERGCAVYALPGNPCVFELTPRLLLQQANKENIQVRIIPGLSFLEPLYVELNIDPANGIQILNATDFPKYLNKPSSIPFTEKLALVIGQVGISRKPNPIGEESYEELVMQVLLKKFPPEHPITLVWSTGLPDYESHSRTFPLIELNQQSGYVQGLASLYVPPLTFTNSCS